MKAYGTPKTECMFCGLILDDHTMREFYGCMAFRKLESFLAARRAIEQGQSGVEMPSIEVCPVCSKTSLGHTEADLAACLARWRKREQGSTGLISMFVFFEGQGTNEEPDPVKRAQYLELWMQAPCGCGKAFGDHTLDETLACGRASRNRGRQGEEAQ